MAIQMIGTAAIPKQKRPPRESKYPFSSLAVGEAFTVTGDTIPSKGATSIRAAAASYRNAQGVPEHRFKVLTDDSGTVTVWRVK
jgi:hypothetical protein